MKLSRRQLIASLGATALAGGALAAIRRPHLLLVDTGLSAASLRLIPASLRTVQAIPIEGDLVRLWRDGLAERIAAALGRVAAIAGHDQALLLAGLAREDRLRTSGTRLGREILHIQFGDPS